MLREKYTNTALLFIQAELLLSNTLATKIQTVFAVTFQFLNSIRFAILSFFTLAFLLKYQELIFPESLFLCKKVEQLHILITHISFI